MIKRFALICLMACAPGLFSPPLAFARGADGVGAAASLGPGLPIPTFTGKTWLDGGRALDAGLAFDFADTLAVHGDLLWRLPLGAGAAEREWSPYAGVGALLLSAKNPPRGPRPPPNDTTLNVNARAPVGIEWGPRGQNFAIFGEIAPGLYVVPDVALSVEGGVGIRWENK